MIETIFNAIQLIFTLISAGFAAYRAIRTQKHAFGSKTVMTVTLRKQDAGLYAKLFYYRNKSRKELYDCCQGACKWKVD